MTYGKKKRPKPPAWTDEEERLIEAHGQLQDNQHTVLGHQYIYWGAIATEMGRSVKAVRAKYEQLRRKGRIQ